ncbi:hypothetical protein ACFL27_04585 [candidate division CSSED10-310 bacterium]|uniref:HEAT repeat domain-containing protein n=1 Tax=candidate division CSSED10-310 bacterium TaxID=2855610 RepID=A0ABV6YTD9_UNCC1
MALILEDAVMAILDNWKQKRLTQKIQKNSHYLTKKTSSKDGRLQAIEILKEIETPEAIAGLLQRFRLTVPEITQDEEEKDYVSGIIAACGSKAKQPLIDFIDRYDEVMHPLTLLAKLIPQEELIAILRDKIEDIGELYSSMKTMKVVEILRHLARYKSDELVDMAINFISEYDDDEVILAAVEILEEQANEKARMPLLELIAQSEATQRIILSVGDMFEKLHWSLKGSKNRNQIEAKLKVEFHILRKGFLKRRKEPEFS